MKFMLQLIAIALLAYILELFLPWYSIALAAFAIGFLLKSRANFLAGFLAIGLVWFFAAWLLDHASSSDLADRVALIFPVKQKSLLFLVTALIGGLVGGFAALTGSLLKHDRRRSY
jgi:hypothetical protein